MEMQNSALLYYQKNKTTKLAWQFIYCDRIGRFKMPADYDKLSGDLWLLLMIDNYELLMLVLIKPQILNWQ
jgi:hypothetical protein